MSTFKIAAKFVKAGDFLPGLGEGYVFEDPQVNDGYMSYPMSRYNVAMPEDTILISFHDAQGEENYLIVTPDTMITVESDVPAEDRDSILEDDEDE